MFVAPLVVPARAPAQPVRRRRARTTEPSPGRWLRMWLACGLAVCLCIPAARGSEQWGATVPFWLVAAPLMNIAWLHRARAVAALRRMRLRRRRATMAVRERAVAAGARCRPV